MNGVIEISKKNLAKAQAIIKELRIVEIWEELGGTCNLVGSVKNGLLMTHLDIDFHTYTDDFSITKSFEAIAKISENPRVKEVMYRNLLDVDDMCLEWHLTYEDYEKRIWTIDIIHIKNESAYVGVIESVTEKIGAVLTDELRRKILQLKFDCVQAGKSIPGILIYEAVIDNNIDSYKGLKIWLEEKGELGISMWEPKV